MHKKFSETRFWCFSFFYRDLKTIYFIKSFCNVCICLLGISYPSYPLPTLIPLRMGFLASAISDILLTLNRVVLLYDQKQSIFYALPKKVIINQIIFNNKYCLKEFCVTNRQTWLFVLQYQLHCLGQPTLHSGQMRHLKRTVLFLSSFS